jgi:SAM-dependent methyltransferase
MKEGFFEWIVSYEDVRAFLDSKYTHISPESMLKVLVIGCGTSTLSNSLANENNIVEVISIDNDGDCISHMSSHNKNKKLKWYTYDIVEDIGKRQNNALDFDGYFDIVVDKGTFDAIHVEGSVSPMLKEIRRLLRIGGVYLMCSINSCELLKALMSIPALQFNVEVYEMEQSAYKRGAVAVCNKHGNDLIDSAQLDADEQRISNQFFQTDHPLLTSEYEVAIRRNFAALSSDRTVPLALAHQAIFGGESALNLLSYGLDLFLEDLADYPLSERGRMTVEEALLFVREMQ